MKSFYDCRRSGRYKHVSKNLLRTMKLAISLFFLAIFGAGATGYSQNQRVSMVIQNGTLQDLLSRIQHQTDFKVVYNDALLQNAGTIKVNVDVANQPVDAVLATVLKSSNLTFKIVGNQIAITPRKKTVLFPPRPMSALSNSPEPSLPESLAIEVVNGTVTDSRGGVLPGASVLVKGTSRGTATDATGKFSIEADAGETLVVSFIGFFAKEVKVGSQKNVTIALAEDVAGLEELVVVGYGAQKKINMTGAVAAISSKEIDSRPVRNLSSAMQGLLPGVTITNHTALPGQNAGTIRIRGVGTIGDANPLVVIDGIPGGDLNILNPDDVESISVLKDAASSSIYGVRGANGVIVVTTKKGKTDTQPTVSYNGYIGIQTPTALPTFLGSPEYMQLLNESQINVGRNPTYTDADIEIARNGSDPNYFANTNWIQEIYKRNTTQQNHNLSVNGGSQNVNYYLSYGYLKEGGLITGDNFHAGRHNVRLRLSTTLIDRINIDANLGYIDRAYSGSSESVATAGGPIYAAHQILPLVPLRFTTGGWGYIGGQRNPVAVTTDGGTNAFSSQEITANLNASIKLFDGLTLRGQYGLIKSNSYRSILSKTINYYSPMDGSLIYQTNPVNKIDVRDYRAMYQTLLGFLEYDKLFAGKHDVKAMIAVSQEENISGNFLATRTNLVSQELDALTFGTANFLNDGGAAQNALRSFFGRANYAFKDKYLAEFNFRHDGSSRFAPEVRWDWFTSGSVGWIFSEEAFFAGLRNIIETGKIRASYGSQGNDRGISNYVFRSTIGEVQNTFPVGNQLTIGYQQTGVPNALLTWESVTKQNLGLDLVSLGGRLGLTADFFVNKTNDILLTVPLPDVLGASYPPQNAGKVENRGWETQLSWRDNVGDFHYGGTFNLSDVQNKVTGLGGVPPTYGDRIRIVGFPIDAFYGYEAERIAQVSDFDLNEATGVYTPRFPVFAGDPVAPGDIIYKDLNDDGRITPEGDRRVIGNAIPRYTYGFRGEMGWKGFDFAFFIQGVGKADGYIQGAARHALINEGSLPQSIHLDRWTPENPNASYPRLTYQMNYNQRLSTYWLEDASYLRLKNVQLGYTVPGTLLQKARINRLRAYVSAENLFTRTNFFYGYDPETPVSSGGFYPQVKTVVFGLNVGLK